jgi:hypothetical protein
MDRTESKNVKIDLTENEYEALVTWIDHLHQVDPTDRAFTILEELDADMESLPPTAATDVRYESDIIDEWSGSDVSFTLAENPSEHRE